MRYKYETGAVTLIQFIILSLLGIANGVNSVVTTCHDDGTDCISNLLVSLIFFLLTAAWFAAIMFLGIMVQERRSRRMAQLLICAEALIALVALFNAKHHTDWLSLFTSLADLALAIWVIILSWRLMRAKGGRVVAHGRGRPRQRRRRPTQD